MDKNNDLEIITYLCTTYNTNRLSELTKDTQNFISYICDYFVKEQEELKKYIINNNTLNFELSNIILNALVVPSYQPYYVYGLTNLISYNLSDKNILLLKGVKKNIYKDIKYPENYIDPINFIYEQLDKASSLTTVVYDFTTEPLLKDKPFLEHVNYKYNTINNFFSNFISQISNIVFKNPLTINDFTSETYNRIFNTNIKNMLTNKENLSNTIMSLIFDNDLYTKLKENKKEIYNNLYNLFLRIIKNKIDNFEKYDYNQLVKVFNNLYKSIKDNNLESINTYSYELNTFYKIYLDYLIIMIVFKNIFNIIPIEEDSNKYQTILIYTINDNMFEYYKKIFKILNYNDTIISQTYSNDYYKYSLKFKTRRLIEPLPYEKIIIPESNYINILRLRIKDIFRYALITKRRENGLDAYSTDEVNDVYEYYDGSERIFDDVANDIIKTYKNKLHIFNDQNYTKRKETNAIIINFIEEGLNINFNDLILGNYENDYK